MEYLLLIFGFVLLILSGHFLVDNSIFLANKLKIKPIIVAVCVISLGTSVPEMFVSVLASIKGNPEISLGNIVGSNIANIAMCLALASFFYPLKPNKNDVKLDWYVLLFSTLILIIFSIDGEIIFIEGLVLILTLVLFMFIYIRTHRKDKVVAVQEEKSKSILVISLIIVASFFGLYYGSKLLIDNAVIIALNLGMTEKLISVTILAFGTSAPEIATVVIAGIKKQKDISIGTIIGSNIINILLGIGMASVVATIHCNFSQFAFDYFVMLLLVFILAMPIFMKKVFLNYKLGLILISIYIIYIYISYTQL